MLRGGRVKDLPGVRYKIIRAALDCAADDGRAQAHAVMALKSLRSKNLRNLRYL